MANYLRDMRVLLDNYDSFTYNLADVLWELDPEWRVVRNDDPVALETVQKASMLVVSPGPGLPENSGCLLEALRWADGRIPILGICLGMQALAQVQGGTLRNLSLPRHGVAGILLDLDPDGPVPEEFRGAEIGLYHSWAVESLPPTSDWRLSGWDREGVPMVMHRTDGRGTAVQFHPESILTPWGRGWLQSVLRAWMNENA